MEWVWLMEEVATRGVMRLWEKVKISKQFYYKTMERHSCQDLESQASLTTEEELSNRVASQKLVKPHSYTT